jgi:hypothetical protein
LAAAEGEAHIADVEYPASALGTPYPLNINGNRAKEGEWRDKLIHRRDTRLAEIEKERHLSDNPPEIKDAAALAATGGTLITIDRDQRKVDIARTERSALGRQAQPLQDLLDRIIFRLAGLTDYEAKALEIRLAKML